MAHAVLASPGSKYRDGNRRGFSLLEIAVVLAIISAIVGMTIMMGTERIEVESTRSSWNELKAIQKALKRFGKHYDRLPCPARLTVERSDNEFGREADDCSDASPPSGITRVEYPASSGTYVRIGAVPVHTLGLPGEMAFDDWGNRYFYAVSEDNIATLDGDTDGVIAVEDGNSNSITAEAVYVIGSHGATKKGATLDTSPTGGALIACNATNLDGENCDGDGLFIDARLNDGETAATFFDDMRPLHNPCYGLA